MRMLVAMSLALLLGGAQAARADDPRVQIGVDSGLEVTGGEEIESMTLISLPLGFWSALPSLRCTVPVSPNVALEPAVGFALLDFEDGGTVVDVRGGLSVLVYPARDASVARGFLRAGVLTRGGKDFGERSFGPQMGVGGGLGLEAPIGARGVFRLEGSYSAYGESDAGEEGTVHGFHVFAVRIGLGVRV